MQAAKPERQRPLAVAKARYPLPGEFDNLGLYAGEQSPEEKGSMSLTVADLAQHIVTLRRLYARVLEADIELLRRAYGESLVDEALRLADEAPRQASPAPQELPPESDERVAEALKRVMDRR
jgi:uncharacterized damage-inducible protein DinB